VRRDVNEDATGAVFAGEAATWNEESGELEVGSSDFSASLPPASNHFGGGGGGGGGGATAAAAGRIN
jgi:hypothetical protein